MSEARSHCVIIKGPRAGEHVSLAAAVVFGRAAPADVVIELATISRRHARITWADTGYVIEDLGSQNGTFINTTRITGRQPLADGDRVHLGGDFEMRFVAASAAPAPAAPTVSLRTGPITGPVTVPGPTPDLAGVPVASAPPEPEAPGGTMIMATPLLELPPDPPQLVVTTAGRPPVIHTLTKTRLRIGRLADNDIVVDNPFVSRHHAELEKRGPDYYLIPSATLSNTLLVDGQPVMEPVRLRSGARIRIGGFAPSEIAVLDYIVPAPEGDAGAQQTIRFGETALVTIGRDKDNTLVLPSPSVSRFHTEIEKVGQRFRVRDLRSSNGTFVNGQRVEGETWVQPSDAIQIGPYRFMVAENEIAKFDETERGVSVEVQGLNKWVNRKLNILQDISLTFKPREFIVVVGQSGGGKSTLVDAIAGYRPATSGRVTVNGSIDVYKEFDAIRSTIGYVPQKDIIHMELTVRQALDYAAQLRMPADTTVEERRQRVAEVMDDLDLAHRQDTQISQLSGGQQKRVSIGVELLTKPGLFFLDEPTSGLDPGMETELMKLMRRLADQGRTIVMITHATKNVMLADKVVFLARGGYLTWFGPPDEALEYFDEFRSERERRSSPMAFDYIYTLLDKEELGSGKDWAERFRKHPAAQAYAPLAGAPGSGGAAPRAKAARPLVQRRQVSALRQFAILSARYMTITARDRFNLLLLICTAPLLASLDFVLAYGVGRRPFSFETGNVNNIIVTLIVLNNTCILVGGLAFMRELVKEREIYRRERMVNLHLSSYILSKLWFALVLAVYQAVCFTIIHYLAFDMPGGGEERIFFFITSLLLVIAGMMIGLFVSALAPNANSAPLLLILFIIPQMTLSGALVTLPEPIMALASSNWAFRSTMALTGVGSDVIGDACWRMPAAEREALTEDEKNANCTCMGINALHEDSCNFPGLGKFYDAAVDEADPPKPVEPGPQPSEPELPPPPDQPADATSVLQLQQYLAALTTYNEEVAGLQDEYKQAIADWQDEQEAYKTQLENYQTDFTELEIKRVIATGSAESSIKLYTDQFGWTFVNKADRAGYLRLMYITWGAQVIITVLLFAATVALQKRREVV
ncbi:MAG: FHA domain-containing protein [Anaerolineales bacterium]|nr:FHA domain-containing protein [Anaerolineales bacterium]